MKSRENELINLPDGRRVAIDRSVGVVLLCLLNKDNEQYILANRRGNRTSEFKEKWNLPSGYLNWDESGEEAAVRETFEETGVSIPLETVSMVEVSTKPTENRQNVIFRYISVIPENYIDMELTDVNSEKEEVTDIKWINIKELSKYEWAFNQKETILRMINKFECWE